MKKQINRALALIIAGIILGASQPASAQTADRAVVNVPFAFTAGERQLPAGRYTVRRVKLDSEAAILIRSEDGGASATVLTNAARGDSGKARLTFRQYGDAYFLAGVYVPGAAVGREVAESRSERGARRGRAKAGGEATVVAVNAR
ncbi:MAG TPA: hypothetical protein VN228_16445 [Pyrinomonadaceae bacterium]|nr:hypothetical protein [Pyrinomonadaceae bacterium]